MSERIPVALVVHGHFYQPPRDNPWTDEVPLEPSAAPFPNWNARINAECYRANAYARVYGHDDRIRAMTNNYERISFNFGPTLARWIDRHDPRTMARIRAGDAAQVARLGVGGALAQVWGHPIAPLLSPVDRRTQILWGLQDFKRRFGRDAEGIWLPETAVDPQTLEALIDAGLTYTILAPEQVAAVRAPGSGWTTVDRDSLDTGRAYRWLHSDGSGRSITLAVFDGALSRDLAFGNAVRDAATFVHRIRAAAGRSRVEGRRLVIAASDGELYGHHKKFADLTLAYATTIEAQTHGVEVTNLAAYLAAEPATWEADLAKGPHGEGTAWSCSHGLGRWRRHCGCAMRSSAESGWSQAWRGPLRDALDLLRDRTVTFFEDAASDLFVDPWGTRDAYGTVLDDPIDARSLLLREGGRPRLAGGEIAALDQAHRLMEMQRSALAMYASCGWFFDDIGGLESGIVLRHAAHLMDLWRTVGGKPPESEFLEVLASARSNQADHGTGADVFRRQSAGRITAPLVVAHAAFCTLVGHGPAEPSRIPGFDVDFGRVPADTAAQIKGQATVVHRRSGERTKIAFSASYDGGTRFSCQMGEQQIRLEDLDDSVARPLRLAALERLAARAPTATTVRAALALAEALGAKTPEDTAHLRRMFCRMLLGLLEAHAPAHVSPEVAEAAEALVEWADVAMRTDESHRAEDLIWETLSHHRQDRRAVPKDLRSLARRLRFSTEVVFDDS